MDATQSTSRIRVLPIHVANKIAAGEVVERPASVLKELLENAQDAGATQIDVVVTAGGRKLISVRDNGSGMDHDDALLAIERQATSKIQDVDDIERIDTLGFRGEALAAIAAVSRFRLVTSNSEGGDGTEVAVAGGQVQDVREVGCPRGTTIEVRDIFFNVPARRKFLRTHQTELTHVRRCFVFQALGCPAIGMSLNVDGRELYRLAGDSTFEDRVRDLFGSGYMDNLTELDVGGSPVRVSGYVGLPGISRADREEQYIFINDRATSAPLIGHALKEAYHGRLPKGRQPVVFIRVELDPTDVDVNVHPTKREVRFRRPSEVRDTLIAAIGRALSPGGVKSEGARISEAPVATPGGVGVQISIDDLPVSQPFHYPRAREFKPDDPGMGFAASAEKLEKSTEGESPDTNTVEADPSAPWSWCRVVGVVGARFVILETEDGYVVMDPRAAHERVLYERYLADLADEQVSTQGLLIPETVELQPGDANRVRKHLELMTLMGFGISEFGGDAFVVDAMPGYFATASAELLIREVSSGLEAAGARRGEGRWREEAVAKAACHAAVQNRDRLKLDEIKQLVQDLARTDMPYTCPSGKPTLIFTSLNELKKKFGRD
jgi:DNA mismatch repair protein MutL